MPTPKDAGHIALRARFTMSKSQAADHDGDQAQATRNGGRECLLENAHGVIPRIAAADL